MIPTLDRNSLIDQFWSNVKKLLIDTHQHTESAALLGINTYKQEMAKRHFEDAVYNQGEEYTAIVVAGLFPQKKRRP